MALVGESEVPAHRYGVSMAISHLRPVCIMALVGESEVPAHRYGVSMAISHLRPESV